jgi:CRISPR-associated endoribonuclease Cas6
MLYSLLLSLVFEAAADVEPTTGPFAHAVFLDWVRQVDPVLAAELHDRDGPKPFTVSPLLDPASDRPLVGRIQPGSAARLRFTILDDQPLLTLARRFLREPELRLRVGDARLAVREATTAAGRWSGATTLDELHAQASLDRTLTLQFLTPTSFSFGRGVAGSRIHSFPGAELAFGFLARRWQTLLPHENSEQWQRLGMLIESQVDVAAYDLRTAALSLGRRPEVGCVGWCRYVARGVWPDEYLRALNALADFAFYAGIGRKTTMGMGQARRLARVTSDE